jgi:hypothetical protein
MCAADARLVEEIFSNTAAKMDSTKLAYECDNSLSAVSAKAVQLYEGNVPGLDFTLECLNGVVDRLCHTALGQIAGAM